MAETKSYKMDLSELTKVVVDRLQKLDPDNVSKITGFILLTEPCEQEMIKLAFGPESTLLSKIHEAKIILDFISPNNTAVSFQNQSVLDPDSIRQLLNLEEKMYSSSSMGNCYYHQDAYSGSLASRTSRRSPSLPEFPIKACHYFYNGYCKHGENCRYYHGQSFPDGYSQAFSSNFNELQSEENGFSSRSLEKLEMEISYLLKSRRGAPVTITLLAMLYYEKYGKCLQADGYLTESQGHGKAGFSLTKLLARLKNCFVLIDRPHGQHSIILAEDAPKYKECWIGRSEPVVTLTSSHQIYLTFPADSTFNEDDVSSYFKQFGPVKDVRIPSQEKRMYGFVSFLYPEIVCEILKKKNIHYICGSRVLVKPYKEKSRLVDRTYIGKSKFSMHYPHQYFDLDSELHGIPRKTDSSRMIKLHLEEQQKMIELKRRQLARFNLVQEPLDQQSYFSFGVDNSKLLEDPNHFPLKDHLDLTLDVLNDGLSSYVKTRNTSDNYSDKESGHIELPDNPFAFSPSVESSF